MIQILFLYSVSIIMLNFSKESPLFKEIQQTESLLTSIKEISPEIIEQKIKECKFKCESYILRILQS